MGFFDARMKVLIKNVFGSAAARFVNLFITLAMVPLTINALSPADYAYFAMAISLSVLASYADLGLGLAVVNVIAQRGARSNSTKAQRAVSVVWFSLLYIAAAGLFLVILLAAWINIVSSPESIHHYNAMLLAAGCVFVGLPTGLVQRVLFAEQKNVQANAWSTAARVLAFVMVWILVKLDHAHLFLLTFAVTGVPMIVGWMSALLILFGKINIELRPKRMLCRYRLSIRYMFLGLSFLVLQTVSYVETGVDSLIVGGAIDLNFVLVYDVYAKLFGYVPALISISIFPLWPAIASAKASGKVQWVLKLKKIGYISIAIISIMVSTLLFIYSPALIEIWIGKKLALNFSVVLGLSIYCILSSIGLFQAMFLNGVGKIKEQVKLYTIYVAILVIAKILAASYFGLNGIVWTLNIFYISRLILSEKLMTSSMN